MNSILPIDQIESLFDKPIRVEQMGLDRFGDIAVRDPDGVRKTAFAVWSRHVRKNPSTNPDAVHEHIQKHGGTFLEGASVIVGEPIIKDIAFSRCKIDDPALDNQFVAYLLVARVFPNDLHIADLNLVNPYKPIPPKLRRYKFRKFKGLGLSGTVLARAEAFAVSKQCDYVTLTAADDDLVPLFRRFGFVLEDDEVANLAMEKKVGK
ncbi:MAG: hypothetical protein HY288_07385 [Planctomycetia bacterium]|nr:hypothetical protein [Planctomycetia bacterium]